MVVKLTLTDTTTAEVDFPTCTNLTDVRSYLNERKDWISINEKKLVNQAHI
jgi:hypothetical protein